jgi:hypothetical protein
MSVSARGVVAGAAIAIVVCAIAAGLYVVGRPADERVRRLDQGRTQDLAVVRDAVLRYVDQYKRLPASLQDLTGLPDAYRLDPVTGRPYEYRATGAATYELCADFDRPVDPQRAQFEDNTWKHGAGRTCFPQVAATLKQLKPETGPTR